MKLAICLAFSLHAYAVNAYNYASQGADWATSGSSGYVESCVGTRQSPIDFKREDAIPVSGFDPLNFSSYCGKIAGKLENNGHTLKFSTADGNPSPGHVISGGPLGNTSYHFLQFHFHWGSSTTRGSEHLVDGERLPAELHLVHVKEDYVTASGVDPAAFEAGDGLAVLGIFLIGGGDESSLSNNWFNVIASGAEDLADGASEVVADINLNLIAKRINPTFADGFNYWHYEGGLTTPNCNEAVQFMITERPLQISDSQMSTFFDLLDFSGDPLINNYREVQDTNCRKISYVYSNVETTFEYKICTTGYYAPDPSIICQDCSCNLSGTNNDSVCDSSGTCTCTTGYTGSKCDDCADGYYSQFGYDCTDCSCNTMGTLAGSSTCNSSGACSCTTGFSGDACDECDAGFTGSACDECVSGFYMVEGACTGCECYTTGTSGGSTACGDCGECSCSSSFKGVKCDECSTPNFYNTTCATDCGTCDELLVSGITLGYSKFNGIYELQGTRNFRPWYMKDDGSRVLSYCDDGGWKLIDSELFPNNCTINPYFGQSESIYYPDNNVICIQKFRTESEAPWLAFRYEDDDLTADDVETENILLSCFL